MNPHSLALAALLAAIPGSVSADEVVTYHGSHQRHGAYIQSDLTFAAAAHVHLDPYFRAAVEGHIYAQPLFWHPARGKALVIAATESNIVYGLDAETGATVWRSRLRASVPQSVLPCGNIDPDGITGTPSIDPAAGVLYLDALTATASGPKHLVYALSLADGSIEPGSPLNVETELAKRGVGFSSATQGERSALQLFDKTLFLNYGGNYGDCGTYHGTVVQLQTVPLKLVASWQTRANGGGIWAQGGLAGDEQMVFATTGNTMGATHWSDGEAIIRLKTGLKHSLDKADYFAPSNWRSLDNSDLDLGGTEALPLNIAAPGGREVSRVIAFGKDGNAYLVDRANLGGIGGQVALLHVSNGEIITAPAVYQTKAATMVAFTSSGGGDCSGGNVTMLKVAAIGAAPMRVAWCAPLNGAGAPIVTTTDGAANPIVWVVGAEGDNLLHGFNALTGHSVFAGGTATMAGLHHFVTPIAAEGRLYVAADNTVYAFAYP